MNKAVRKPNPEDQAVLESLQIQIAEPAELSRCHQLLDQHHYLGSPKPVGERLYYVVTDAQGQWLAVLIFAAAAKHLRASGPVDWLDRCAAGESVWLWWSTTSAFCCCPSKPFPIWARSRCGWPWPA